jgi:transcriptional regulator with XRE-family HTH domain
MTTKQQLERQLEDNAVRLILEKKDLTQKEIADLLGVSVSYIQSVAKRRRVQRPRGCAGPAWKLRHAQKVS